MVAYLIYRFIDIVSTAGILGNYYRPNKQATSILLFLNELANLVGMFLSLYGTSITRPY